MAVDRRPRRKVDAACCRQACYTSRDIIPNAPKAEEGRATRGHRRKAGRLVIQRLCSEAGPENAGVVEAAIGIVGAERESSAALAGAVCPERGIGALLRSSAATRRIRQGPASWPR